ncbi:hypothetical protein ACFVVU_21410 [Kitasatospora sp. NPDC057965]|uniref:hypothetical protein n=1 Tax=Kitasatospora sp. NPDC057965 TaxID=3346291 RepID=UPI0036DB345F
MTNLAAGTVGTETPEAEPSGAAAPVAPAGAAAPGLLSRRWAQITAEVLVSVVAAVGFTLLCTRIDVNPLNRIGQVSGLAKIQQYVAVVGLPLLAVLVFTAYRGTLRRHRLTQRLVCAALAGLSTGVIAGGVVVALNGTPWPLGGQEGDPSVLVHMATGMLDDKGLPGVYPPGFPALIALWAKIRYHGIGGEGFALHDLQILFSALVGPMSYLSWRLLLRPFWALLIAVPAAVVFLDPIRPYSHVVMIMLVPLLTAVLREVRRAGELSTRSALLRGLGFGVVFGLLFLWYSGWYLWSAPGIAVLTLFVFPWRGGRTAVRNGLALIGTTVVSAGLVGSPLLYQLATIGADVPDRYGYIMVYTDPTYIMGWMSDRVGQTTYHDYPASGELAGQSGFAILLVAGVGLGIGLGLRNLAVRTAAAVLAGAWLMRFTFAGKMAQTGTVALYPRTTWIILYCLMILAVLGLMAAFHRGSGWLERVLRKDDAPAGSSVLSGRMLRQLAAGLVCALALFGTMGASWSVNRYMPEHEKAGTMGLDAWRAHTIKKADGSCPRFAPVSTCADIIVKDWTPDKDDKKFVWCAGVATEDWQAVCGRRAPWDNGPAK